MYSNFVLPNWTLLNHNYTEVGQKIDCDGSFELHVTCVHYMSQNIVTYCRELLQDWVYKWSSTDNYIITFHVVLSFAIVQCMKYCNGHSVYVVLTLFCPTARLYHTLEWENGKFTYFTHHYFSYLYANILPSIHRWHHHMCAHTHTPMHKYTYTHAHTHVYTHTRTHHNTLHNKSHRSRGDTLPKQSGLMNEMLLWYKWSFSSWIILLMHVGTSSNLLFPKFNCDN